MQNGIKNGDLQLHSFGTFITWRFPKSNTFLTAWHECCSKAIHFYMEKMLGQLTGSWQLVYISIEIGLVQLTVVIDK
jgi:hypothetical protein